MFEIIMGTIFVILSLIALRVLNKERNRANALQSELDELTTNLYGSPQNYERAKDNVRECHTDREQKVAKEAADKGITRAAKQYPSRFKGTRT